MNKMLFVIQKLPKNIIETIYNNKQEFEQISFAQIKNSGIIPAIKILRSVKDMHVFIADSESKHLIDIFLLLFFFTKSKKMRVIYSDFSEISYNKINALFAIVRNIFASIFSFYILIRSVFISRTIKKKSQKNESMHILYLKSNFWFNVIAGGSVAHVDGVIAGFNKIGFKVDFCGIDPPASLKTLNSFIKAPIPKFFSCIYTFNLYLFDYLLTKHLKKQLDTNKYCFIYHRMALNSLSGVLLSKKLSIPLILEYNGPEVAVQRSWGKPLLFEKISQCIENANIRCADKIVTVSEKLKDQLINQGVPESKIICYPNGVDPEKFNPELFPPQTLIEKRKKMGFSENDIILSFIGTFGKWHGVEVLAHTIRKLFELHPQWIKEKRVKFMLLGDGPCMLDVKNILSEIPDYSHFVTLTGLIPQEETPAYLTLSNVFLCPHAPPNENEEFFGSPTKLFEYMIMKKVIIASDLGQIGEVLSPSININNIEKIDKSALAILFRPGNVDEFVTAIKYAVDHLPDLDYIGANAQLKALTHYTWEKHVKYIVEN